jgi:hypothetical protein
LHPLERGGGTILGQGPYYIHEVDVQEEEEEEEEEACLVMEVCQYLAELQELDMTMECKS